MSEILTSITNRRITPDINPMSRRSFLTNFTFGIGMVAAREFLKPSLVEAKQPTAKTESGTKYPSESAQTSIEAKFSYPSAEEKGEFEKLMGQANGNISIKENMMLVVDLSEQTLIVMKNAGKGHENGEVVIRFPISTGRGGGWKTPTGKYFITSNIAYGTGQVVDTMTDTFATFITSGDAAIGFHGTALIQSIGDKKPQSAGCVRMLPRHVKYLDFHNIFFNDMKVKVVKGL